ncbi:MAG: hypothetical protein PVG78_02205 [Desulfobacterales bacterium]|jgi:hypothetical protein
MSNREKIILALMGIAILYGAYTYLGPTEQGASPAQSGKEMEALNAYVLGIAGSLPRLSLSDTEKYVMASAVARWPEEPFLRTRLPESRDVSGTGKPMQPEDLDVVYTGYVEMNSRRLAIINGKEYAPGDALEFSGYVVRRIDPAKVELGIAGSDKTVTIPIEEMFEQQEKTIPPGKRR